ncbi:hypothetical protein [Deinococcus aquaticus]|uniref:hypothetical protein n=1 Tax=Deinococcus aquaticus TaxID=328692 RepID=UPI0030A2CC11
MSAAAPMRTKLRQARLGGVQRQVLDMLVGQKAEADMNGTSIGGLTYRDLMAGIHQYVVIGERLWLPSVVARIEINEGRPADAAGFLLNHIADAIDVAYPIATRLLEMTGRPFATAYLAVEGVHIASRAVTRLEKLRAQFRAPIQFQQLERVPHMSDPEAGLLNAWGGAHALALATTPLHEAAQSIHALPLPEEMKEKALVRLAGQHPSLSRSLRTLEIHRLIRRKEIEGLTLSEDGELFLREARFFITEEGLARLRPD